MRKDKMGMNFRYKLYIIVNLAATWCIRLSFVQVNV